MKIDLAKIADQGADYEGAEEAAVLGLDGVDAEALGPLTYNLRADCVSGQLIVKGAVAATLKMECARCGVFFSTTVREPAFLRAYEIDSIAADVLDITDDLRESVLLEMPHYPLCSRDCAGRCPVCGKNLKAGSCSCEPEQGRGHWDELDKLKLK